MKTKNEIDLKNKIITLFKTHVKGKKSNTISSNIFHDGKDGHWLELQMGIKHNAKNEPDIYGFEMKNHTRTKTTFGDWSPNYAIYKGKDKLMTREEFLRIFGAPNIDGRYSWSGKPCPKIEKYNTFGQRLVIDKENNILVIYSYSKDTRTNKSKILPKKLQINNLEIARWKAESIKNKVERKFNKLGWFKCTKDASGVYRKIVFGDPINFDAWIKGVKSGLIFFDSGMYSGNPRPYSQWRANNKYWDSLITDEY